MALTFSAGKLLAVAFALSRLKSRLAREAPLSAKPRANALPSAPPPPVITTTLSRRPKSRIMGSAHQLQRSKFEVPSLNPELNWRALGTLDLRDIIAQAGFQFV